MINHSYLSNPAQAQTKKKRNNPKSLLIQQHSMAPSVSLLSETFAPAIIKSPFQKKSPKYKSSEKHVTMSKRVRIGPRDSCRRTNARRWGRWRGWEWRRRTSRRSKLPIWAWNIRRWANLGDDNNLNWRFSAASIRFQLTPIGNLDDFDRWNSKLM